VGKFDIIKVLAMAPESQLDPQGAKLCADWDGQDPVRFIRDLLDLCVRYAWSSGYLITLLDNLISDEPPEAEEEADARRAELLAKWEPDRREDPS